MSPSRVRSALSLLFAALAVTAIFAATAAASEEGRYIVVLKDSVEHPGAVAEDQTEETDGELGFVYRHALSGYSAILPQAEVEALEEDPRVAYVSPDHKVEAFSQTIPTGISRIGAAGNASIDIDGSDADPINADVAVIDTGVDYTHPDLNVVARTDCSKGTETEVTCVDNSGTDTEWHGTHVAGTIGALDNGIGVVGVAPGARIWSVKVLGTGINWESELTAGVDWVTARASQIEVANMSLGCGCSLPVTEEAIEASMEEGVVYVVAAGNNSADAKFFSPGRNPNVITVSAIADYDGQPGGKGGLGCAGWGSDDTRATFSNFGSVVDVAAPGACIPSTFPGGEYGLDSGTSMAAPHVAGAAALLASTSNPSSKEDVEAIRDEIVEAGNFEWTDTSGDGVQEPLLDVSDELLFFVGAPPTAITDSKVTYLHHRAARVAGTIQPNGLNTRCKVEYGTTTAYGESASCGDVSFESKSASVSVSLTDLRADTLYHFRVVALNGKGTAYGEDQTFTTADLDSSLNGVSCPSSSECVAAGWVNNPESEQKEIWLGRGVLGKWEEWPGVKAPSGVLFSEFTDVSCPWTGRCMVVGDAVDAEGNLSPLLYSAELEIEEEPPVLSAVEVELPAGASEAKLLGIDCNPECIAVGYYRDSEGAFQPLSVNGLGEVLTVPLPEGLPEEEVIGGKLRGISCVSGTKCFAVGGYDGEYIDEANEVVEFTAALYVDWDGSSWGGTLAEQLPPGSMTDVSCVESTSTCAAVGEGIAAIFQPGEPAGIWKSIDISPPVGIDPSTSCLGSAGTMSCGAVGAGSWDESMQGAFRTGAIPTLPKWGGSWSDKDPASLGEGVISGFNGVDCRSAGDCTAVGWREDGKVNVPWHWDGSSWAQEEFKVASLDLTFGSSGSGNGKFNFPEGVAIDAGGNVWVADTGNGRIQKFNSKGEYLTQFGSLGSANGKLNNPTEVAIDPEGDLWVLDLYNHRVQRFNSKGEYLSKIDFEAVEEETPIADIAIGPEGNLFIVDPINHRVQKFSSKGEFLSQFGSSGSGNGKFSAPEGVAIDAGGNVWVADTGNGRIQKFNSKGEYLTQFGSYGSGSGKFNTPKDIAVDASGNVWVADSGNHRVQKFNSKGEYLGKFGSYGASAGQFKYPAGIATDATGNVWIADYGNARIQRWAP
jgi:subtilisin family serine protease/sugar lactone lactonase YvrE